MSREEAQADAEEAKLKFEVSSEEYNTEVPEGFVISQDPKYIENYNVKEGSTVKVVVSKGTEKATVPNVEGKEESEAIKLIEDANLKAEVIEETSQTVKEGYVISQETDPDTEVSAGDTVKIHVSTGTGIKQVTVQSVVGQTEANARATLEGQGLKVTVTNEEDTSKENGVVLKQSIESGKTVNEGTAITITVNKITEAKNVKLTINVKSITGYKEPTTNDINTTTETKTDVANIEIKVDDKTVYTDSNVDKSTTNKTATVQIKGTQSVQIIITDKNGGSWSRSQNINSNTTTELTIS